jgi:hypothetical protein
MGRKSGRCSKQGLMGKGGGLGQRDLAFFTFVNGGIHLACPLVFCILYFFIHSKIPKATTCERNVIHKFHNAKAKVKQCFDKPSRIPYNALTILPPYPFKKKLTINLINKI